LFGFDVRDVGCGVETCIEGEFAVVFVSGAIGAETPQDSTRGLRCSWTVRTADGTLRHGSFVTPTCTLVQSTAKCSLPRKTVGFTTSRRWSTKRRTRLVFLPSKPGASLWLAAFGFGPRDVDLSGGW